VLNKEQIEENKAKFLELLEKIKEYRTGVDWDKLTNYLETSGFFTAPASRLLHSAYMGGLCEHSLNTYEAMMVLVDMTFPDEVVTEEDGTVKSNPTCPYAWNVLATVALLHDIGKANLYEASVRNKKVYSASGTKYDQLGKYDWISEPSWEKRELDQRFMYGNTEENSVFKLLEFMKLSKEETVAILHHSGYFADNYERTIEYAYAYSKSPLCALLHLADEYAMYLMECNDLVNYE